MALWNPFNLFKRKESTTEDPPQTPDPSADQASPPAPASPSPGTPEPFAGDGSFGPEAAAEEGEQAATTDLHPETSAAQPASPSRMGAATDSAVESAVDSTEDPAAAVALAPQATPAQLAQDKTAQAAAIRQESPRSQPSTEPPPSPPPDLSERISRRPNRPSSPGSTAKPEKNRGLTGWFRSAIRKTAQVLNTDIRDLVGREGRLVDEEFLQELFAHLIKTDMGVTAASEIRDSIQRQYRGRIVQLGELIRSAKSSISEMMKQEEVRLTLADQGTSVVMVVGVNGSGKTTSIAKLANLFRQDGKSVVLGAGDTFRAAAVEQLRQWAGRIGAEIVTGPDRSDPASVAFRAVKQAVEQQADICSIDTAGRLQTQSHLMLELSKIRRVIDKVVPGAPHETLLVLDATAGQNAISQARGFSEAAGCSGIVLAKLDGTAKGGVAIPIRKEFNLPVKFIGFGETAADLAPFDVARYVDALFDIE